MKKIIFLVLVTFCLFNFTLTSYANESEVSIINTDDPRYVPVCGVYSYHDMRPCWTCACYYPGNLSAIYIPNAKLWQCSRCHKYLATEGDIILNQMTTIGKYGVSESSNCFPGSLITFFEPEYIGYTSNNYLSGYHFHPYIY